MNQEIDSAPGDESIGINNVAPGLKLTGLASVQVGKMLKFSTYPHIFAPSSATTHLIQLAIIL